MLEARSSTEPANPAGGQVLEFYRTLPFNMTQGPEAAAEAIRTRNSAAEYPPLLKLVHPGKRVLEVGCGIGWMANTLAFHQGAAVTAIDFNPVALEFARETARQLGTSVAFKEEDLFAFKPDRPFDVVLSLGVLHHTSDCMGTLAHICRTMVRAGGFAFVGLYHKFGRRPFLEHFAALRAQGLSEEDLLQRFAALFGDQSIDELHVRSWFRDQVLHPHETQHTLAEVIPVLGANGLSMLAHSLNDFDRSDAIEPDPEFEAAQESLARGHLERGAYWPGFFCFLAKKSA